MQMQAYVATDVQCTELVRELADVAPTSWKCPCDEGRCEAMVFYARRASDARVVFVPNLSFAPALVAYAIDNVEDFEAMMEDDRIPELDRMLMAMWLDSGLREALLNA